VGEERSDARTLRQAKVPTGLHAGEICGCAQSGHSPGSRDAAFPGRKPSVSTLDEEWASRVRALGPEPDDEQLGAVAGAMVHQATSPGRVAAALHGESEQLGRRLLSGLDFVGLLGTLYGAPPASPTARAWVLTHMVESELHLRGQLAARLRQALFDRELVDEPPLLVAAERTSPRRRVCDEAYLSLRSLFHPEEDAVGFVVDRDGFLALPESEKDRLIEQALIRGAWNLSPFELPDGPAP